MDLEVQSRALARVSHMSGGAPDDAHCMFCLDGGDAVDPLVRGCACRGSSGWSHATCLVQSAEAAPVPPLGLHYAAWISCSICKQRFTGLVQLRLAIALWAKYAACALETDLERLGAVDVYAGALAAAGEHAEAARLHRGIMDVRTRTWGPEHSITLISASNLAASLVRLGECAEAAVLLRTELAARTCTVGADDKGTLAAESLLVVALLRLEKYAEAETLCRGTLEKKRRVLGREHPETLTTFANLAFSLGNQGKYAEAVEIEREVLVKKTRCLGAEHESTLISANNLALTLWTCGQKAECKQVLRDTLALSQRALGPNHEVTESVLQKLRTFGLIAR